MSTSGLELKLHEAQIAVRDMAREFAEKEMRPVVRRFDDAHEFPAALVGRLGELGFLGMTWPEDLGGAGLTDLESIVIIEELARIDPSIALTVASHNSLCTGHIMLHASDGQKRKYVPDLASGKKLGAWGLTEPGSGSDAGGMKSTAQRDGSSYVLNGSKTFITQGSVAGTYVIMALTDPARGRKGISAFIVEKGTPGLTIGKTEEKLGMRASDTAMLLFDGLRIPAENRIGDEGDGFRQALAVLDGGRIGIAALSVGIAQGALDASIAYARDRKQFGRAIGENQAIQWKLADMATEIEAARLMTHHAAWLRVTGQPFGTAASKAKLFASETAVRAANEAVQIHGGYGFIKEFPVEKFYRDVKLMTIGEGTSEIQRMIIARALLAF